MTARYPALDSLRGIAAAVVVVDHLGVYYHTERHLLARPAVMLFFVLSGFVLALPFLTRQHVSWPEFLIRRGFRLWPPIVASTLISALLLWLTKTEPRPVGVSWSEPLTFSLIGRCLSFQEGGCTLLPQLWTLVFEARISLIFPILAIVTFRCPKTMAMASVICGFATTTALAKAVGGGSFAVSLITMVHFGAMFALGALVARYSETISRWNSELTRRGAIVGLILSFMLCYLPFDFANALGGSLFVALSIGNGILSRILRHAPFLWLGRVSFSLYLVHVPILLAFVYTIQEPPALITVPVALIVVAVASEVLYRLVERPSIILGRRLVLAFSGYPVPATL